MFSFLFISLIYCLQKVKGLDNENGMKEKTKEGCGGRKKGPWDENQRREMDISIRMEPSFSKDAGDISVEGRLHSS